MGGASDVVGEDGLDEADEDLWSKEAELLAGGSLVGLDEGAS